MAFLTMRSTRQAVATDGNSLGMFDAFLGRADLRPVATGCNHARPAPQGSGPRIRWSSTALGFYLVMGAAHVGHRRSDAERWLPLLRVAVPSDASRS